ncbi:hypothetical protein D4764_06G0009010 [Takifugu flavidus]|uniref:Zinc finger CCHC domain-containing protein 7 n=1 Tax=Takifugu flavidus TaxID=433684 RepID=A0A5C6MZ52_9TELE|nr:hypothetical protein D4764_06G0009010 [Takifugu flavidus]
MYSPYHVGEDLEDAIYQEDEGDSEASEINSELEFRLYSQLHYSSNAGDMGELVDTVQEAEGQVLQQLEATSEPADGDKENEERRVLSPDANNIDLNKKKIKQSIKKKRKTNPEKQNLTFSFEEVIVIDSSPEVISVSDDNDSSDDTGVCNLKQHRSQRRQTSTPSQQETQKSIRALGTLLSVDSSSLDSDSGDSGSNLGSSDSSDLSDSDDSDDLENWMILGRGNQDGDQSISLNLEGKFDSNAGYEMDSDGPLGFLSLMFAFTG